MSRGQRARNLYNPDSAEPYKISRSKIDLFTECPRCFYLDLRLGVGRPSLPGFALNSAVDVLFKKEFDIHRAEGTPHPLMKVYGIEAVPLAHNSIDEWRNNFKGIKFYHEPTNFVIYGAVDDIWINKKGELIVVDYKATSTSTKITLDAEYRQSYKRQLEIYQWLLKQNGFPVARTAYIVYANGNKDKQAFDGKLEFNIEIISHEGNTDWVEETLFNMKKCLAGELPPPAEDCAYCAYRKAAAQYEN
jgi:CRISPR/Cas system-associated exonuclease Cas4 (RecB family)